ncbi:GlyGly-CTERM sorting domain-containing protein, partial [Vibrio sp. FNV 38]|nr:GlyGly-CTERM sorting domain-containing protein [Vibrio sp. FNV 38]
PGSFSYSYNDEVGSLDYMLADPKLMPFIIDGTDWAINAVESTLFEYTREHTGDLTKFDDAFRSSDHDPAIIVIKFDGEDETTPSDKSGASTSLFILMMLSALTVLRRRRR